MPASPRRTAQAPTPAPLAAGLAHVVTLDRAAREVVQLARQITGCDAAAVAVTVEGSDDLHLVQGSDFDGAADTRPAVLDAGRAALATEAVRSGAVAVRRDGAAWELAVPMLTAGAVLGVLVAEGRGSAGAPLPSATQAALTTLAAEGAVALARAAEVRRLERRQRVAGTMATAVGTATELRAPLFGIASAAQLLRFRVRDDPVVEKNVGRILREVERLNAIVAALLEYGRPNPSRGTVEDPELVWDEVIAASRARLESKALLVERRRGRTSAPCAIDPGQLRLLLHHLFTNACDAAPEGSDLSLESTSRADGRWTTRLRNGGEIPAEILPRVFEMFVSSRPGGPGLGLTLCRRIVDEIGGTIDLTSDAEQGTVVTVVLPTVGADRLS